MRRAHFVSSALGGLALLLAHPGAIGAEPALLAELRGSTRVEITHLPNEYSTYASLTRTTLHRQRDLSQTSVTSTRTIARIERAIAAARPRTIAAPRTFDVRWDVRFHKPGGAAISLEFDRFGRVGRSGEVGLVFDGVSLPQRLAALLRVRL